MVLGLLSKADIGDDALAVRRGVEKLANADSLPRLQRGAI
jgi:hypothetical protein